MRAGAVWVVALLCAGPFALAGVNAPVVGVLAEPLTSMGAAVVEGSVFLAGGANGSVYSGGVWRFEPGSGSVSRVGTLPAVEGALDGGRIAGATFALGGKVYVAGGVVRRAQSASDPVSIRALAQIVEFDPATNATRVLGDVLPSARYGMGVAVVEGRAFLFGGSAVGGADPGRDVLRFDPTQPEGARVSLVASLPAALRDTRAVAVDEGVLLVGGTASGSGEWACPANDGRVPVSCPTRNVALFVPATGATRVIAQLPVGVQGAEVGRLSAGVFVVGGAGENLAVVNASRIDVAAARVVPAPPVENVTQLAATAVVDDVLYLFGGRVRALLAPLPWIRAYDGAESIPGPALGLVARPEGTSMRVSWLPPAGAANATYTLERVAADGATTRVYVGNATSALDPPPAGAPIRYRLAVGAGRLHVSLAETRAVAGAAPPPAVEDLLAWSAEGRVHLLWSAPSEASAILVYRDGALVGTLQGNATSYHDGALGSVYHVRALVGDREGEPGAGIVARALAAPVGLAASLAPREERTSYDLRVVWDASGWAAHELLLGDAPDALALEARVDGGAWLVPRVAPGADVWVSARRVAGELVGPAAPALRVRAPAAPAAPAWVFANGSDEGIVLAWEDAAPAGATYTLWRTGADGAEVVLAENVTDARHLDASAESGVLYVYRVTSEGELRSAFSREARATRDAAPQQEEPRVLATPSPSASAVPEHPSSPPPSAPPAPATGAPTAASPTPGAPASPLTSQETPAPGLAGLLVSTLIAGIASRRALRRL